MLVVSAIISVIYSKSLNIMLYMYLGVFRYAYPQNLQKYTASDVLKNNFVNVYENIDFKI